MPTCQARGRAPMSPIKLLIHNLAQYMTLYTNLSLADAMSCLLQRQQATHLVLCLRRSLMIRWRPSCVARRSWRAVVRISNVHSAPVRKVLQAASRAPLPQILHP
jgi:hypothetical protein